MLLNNRRNAFEAHFPKESAIVTGHENPGRQSGGPSRFPQRAWVRKRLSSQFSYT